MEILTKYNESHPKEAQPEAKPPELDVEDRLVKLLETQKLATNEVRVLSEEERRIRDQILAQYSQVRFYYETFKDIKKGLILAVRRRRRG